MWLRIRELIQRMTHIRNMNRLQEGAVVSCKVVDELQILETVYVTSATQKDWEILEGSKLRIQNTFLDQSKIVNVGQNLVIWINNAIEISLKIENLSPDIKFGKVDNSTELIVAPFEKDTSETKAMNTSKKEDNKSQSSLYHRLFNKDISPAQRSMKTNNEIIDSRTLNNVSAKSSIDDEDDDSSESTKSSETMQYEESPYCRKSKEKLNSQYRSFKNLLTEISIQERKIFKFRVVPRAWNWNDSHMCDVYVSKPFQCDSDSQNTIFALNYDYVNDSSDLVSREYYVNLKIDAKIGENSKNSLIELNNILMAKLKMEKYSRVTLTRKTTVVNFLDKIELIPSNKGVVSKQEIMENFKQMLLNSSGSSPLLINQDQVFTLCGGTVFVTVKIYPESFKYCLCDGDILRERKIFVSDQTKDIEVLLKTADEISSSSNKMAKHQKKDSVIRSKELVNIVEDCVKSITTKNCLTEMNQLRKMGNFLITGTRLCGKSTICEEIINRVEKPPYHCFVETFYCSQNKGRKIESIQKDLRNILTKCVERAPSILVMEDLDALAKCTNEHTQNADYYNQISEIIKHMIEIYTMNTKVSVIGTVTTVSNLNQRLYSSRGNQAYGKIFKMSELTKDNRKKIIKDFCRKNNIKNGNIDFYKFATLTEGYTIGHLLQFMDRATFYAHRNDNTNPVLTNDVLIESLITTNTYCMQGIKNNVLEDNEIDRLENVDRFPGLEMAVNVFEEIMMWPKMWPTIFEHNPLRNQAGILLFGAPGTGKTNLVTQISNYWNLRMIAVKGPELLAKFIGQSEENVRNIFERARNAKPCVLFFDEFDSIAPRRGHDSTGVTDRVVNQLLTELDGVEELKGVVVVAATSRPDLLDPALLRSGRIDRLVYCSFPDSAARLNLFKSLAKLSSLNLSADVDFDVFCGNNTQNYTGADIKSILVSANMIAVRDCIAKNSNVVPNEISINQKHLEEAFISTVPSLSNNDVEKYKFLYSKFINQDENKRTPIAFNQKQGQRTTLA